jgi:hypothetical protein
MQLRLSAFLRGAESGVGRSPEPVSWINWSIWARFSALMYFFPFSILHPAGVSTGGPGDSQEDAFYTRLDTGPAGEQRTGQGKKAGTARGKNSGSRTARLNAGMDRTPR